MTFSSIYTEVINLRFNGSATKTAQVKNWVNQAEIALWNAADWSFKRVPATNVTVSGGAVTEPADFGKVIALYNASGDKLSYLDPDQFEQYYVVPPTPSGVGEAYTVIDRQIIVGPQDSGTYKLAYRRRYTHRNNSGTPTQGVMSVDTDTPYWDSEHHYILVPWAIRMGKYLEDDPTGSLTEQLLVGLGEKSMFEAMKDELVTGMEGDQMSWGAVLTW